MEPSSSRQRYDAPPAFLVELLFLMRKAARMLYKQGRHLRASVWCIQQYVVDLQPDFSFLMITRNNLIWAMGAVNDISNFSVSLS